MKEEIQNLSEEILEIEYKLNSYITSTLWVSDLHGEGKKFARILKERFGMLYQTFDENICRVKFFSLAFLDGRHPNRCHNH